MYLHLGQNVVVPQKIIIGIFELDNCSYSHITRKFLEKAEKEGRVYDVSGELPRSFVLCEENGKHTVYLSQLSSATLLKRSENNVFD